MRRRSGGQKPLAGGMPRVFADHRSPSGRVYRDAYRAFVRRFPGLPSEAALWLKEAALIATELNVVASEANVARARGQVRKPRALANHAIRLRSQLMDIESRLASMVPAPKKPTIQDVFFSGAPKE